MSRVYFIRDAGGERRAGDRELPLQVGGSACGGVVVAGVAADDVVALIAVADGHAYIQPASDRDDDAALFHNHARITQSTWLKSGDRVQVGESVIGWTVEGDQVFIDVDVRDARQVPTPPSPPPPSDALPREPPVPLASPAQRRPRRLVTRAAMAAFAVLALAAAYVTVATPVTIAISPEPDHRALSGFPPPVRVWGQYLALPGSYAVQATREGYYPLDEAVEVAMGERVDLAFELAELPGRLTVELAPAVSYRLVVDGEVGRQAADGSWEVTRGLRLLRVETDRYLPAETEIDVVGFGRPQTLSFALQPAWAEVFLATSPAGARVMVDEEAVGVTPLTVEILQGRPTIELSLAAHKPVTVRPEITAGVRVELDDIVLPPADGFVDLDSTPPGASVRVGDDFRGTTPVRLALTPGSDHRIRLSKPGFVTAERDVRVEPEAEQQLAITLAPSYGVVFVTSDPADAELLVDGDAVGTATQRLRLTTRPHALEVRKAGYVPERVAVTPRVGVSQSVDVVLKTHEQAKIENTPPTITTGAGQTLRLIRPGGPFAMGASRRDPGRRANESARRVELTRPYYIGETEVSNAEFRSFKPDHDSGSAEGSWLGGERQPVVGVSWDDAARYCNWLSDRDGLPAAYREQGGGMAPVVPATTGYRLPTEAEWAYAARVHGRAEAGRYPWQGGYPPAEPVGNFADARIADTLADVVPGYDDGYRGTAPVASFVANPAGLYDLAGNVAEWTNDWYAIYPAEADRLVRDPAGPASGEHHLVRGSSWRHGNITELRASYRDYSRTPRDDLGFRIARGVE